MTLVESWTIFQDLKMDVYGGFPSKGHWETLAPALQGRQPCVNSFSVDPVSIVDD